MIELKPEAGVLGVGIIQPGNALRALHDLGLLDQCLAEGFQIDDYVMYDAAGGYIGRMKLLRIAGPSIPAVNGLPRIDATQSILTEAAEMAGAPIRLGLTVSSSIGLVTTALMLSSATARGKPTILWSAPTASALTSAQMMFGKEYDAAIHRAWRVAFHGATRPPEVDHQIMYYGVGVKAGLMPVSREQMYLLLVTTSPTIPGCRPSSWVACCASGCGRFRLRSWRSSAIR